jgi:hypothetical protein
MRWNRIHYTLEISKNSKSALRSHQFALAFKIWSEITITTVRETDIGVAYLFILPSILAPPHSICTKPMHLVLLRSTQCFPSLPFHCYKFSTNDVTGLHTL